MHADLVDQATIGSWEGAIAEHSRMNLAPLRAPGPDSYVTGAMPMAHALARGHCGGPMSQLTPPSFEGKVYALGLLRNPDTLSVD